MKKLLLIPTAFFTLLSIVFTILPMGTLAILPIGLALLLGFFAFRKTDPTHNTFPKILLFTSLFCLLIVIGKAIFVKEEVTKDVQFEQTIEKSKEEDKKELEELENLEADLE
ncbi:hypothetical protein ABGT15_10895 [Flavobacterium enshiense]|uniref:hypothetical protein n=1 Tax=Flavobacterium enshiense TaxID=1341165 RepID=UPI00345CF0D7